MTATSKIKTISDGGRGQIQGTHVATLPDGRITIRIDKATDIPCKWKAGFLHNYCSYCGRDEGEMKDCKWANTKDEFHTGKEIERTEG
ncbi:hypothetical protein J7400_19035 [Shimia sp. R9_2]|uniref:hypothetical protein n=1 Tax=Shimia sp. R9_2 TaxID=2821112 RepID=UPI001ADC230D|nr:hypothetical protein [Shimia sp. R9_2]MBO9398773.1 hypothetical protein [Shimia sp. R9_2]